MRNFLHELYGLHPTCIPELAFAPSSQVDTEGSSLLAEGSDWLENQKKAFAVAENSIQAALGYQLINADRGRRDGAYPPRIPVDTDSARSALCESGT